MIALDVLILDMASCRNDRAYPEDDQKPHQETPGTFPLRNEDAEQDGSRHQQQETDGAEEYFIVEAAKMDLKEVELGRPAHQKGGSEAVRSFGKMLVQEHSRSLETVKSLGEIAHCGASYD